MLKEVQGNIEGTFNDSVQIVTYIYTKENSASIIVSAESNLAIKFGVTILVSNWMIA